MKWKPTKGDNVILTRRYYSGDFIGKRGIITGKSHEKGYFCIRWENMKSARYKYPRACFQLFVPRIQLASRKYKNDPLEVLIKKSPPMNERV